jgi:hypothetical protein
MKVTDLESFRIAKGASANPKAEERVVEIVNATIHIVKEHKLDEWSILRIVQEAVFAGWGGCADYLLEQLKKEKECNT